MTTLPIARLPLIVAILLISANNAFALLLINTTDHAAWNASKPAGPTFLLDLNAFTNDAFYSVPGGIDLGPLTAEASAGSFNFIDVQPFVGLGDFAIDGTPYLFLRAEADSGAYAELRFDIPLRAFGAQVGRFGVSTTPPPESLVLEFLSADGDVVQTPSDLQERSFWGFTSDEPVAHIRFLATNSNGSPEFGFNFSLDNVEGVPIPEPAALALLLTAAAAPFLEFIRRKR